MASIKGRLVKDVALERAKALPPVAKSRVAARTVQGESKKTPMLDALSQSAANLRNKDVYATAAESRRKKGR